MFWAARGNRPAVAGIPKIMPAMAGTAGRGRHTQCACRGGHRSVNFFDPFFIYFLLSELLS